MIFQKNNLTSGSHIVIFCFNDMETGKHMVKVFQIRVGQHQTGMMGLEEAVNAFIQDAQVQLNEHRCNMRKI
jgi:hypothetical protein